MSTDNTADELQAESEISYPVRTLRRLLLIIRNPLRSARYIAYDPDLLIIPVMFVLFAFFAFLQPYVLMAKIDMPGEVKLYSPEAVNITGKEYITVSELKTEAQKLYWGSTLTYYAILLVLTFVVLYLAARVIMGSARYKVILSGATYSSVVLFVIGLAWLGASFAVPNVVVPYFSRGNISYIPWRTGKADLVQVRSVAVLANFTAPRSSQDTDLWALNLSTVLVQSGTKTMIDEFRLTGLIQGGTLTVNLPDGTVVRPAPGTNTPLLTSKVKFVSQGGKTYVARSDGSLLELQQNAIIKLESRLRTNRERSNASTITWSAGGGLIVSGLKESVLVTNASAPKSITGNVTYNYWSIFAKARSDGALELLSNLTVAHIAQGDKGLLTWAADSVVAQPSSIMMYYNEVMATQTSSSMNVVLQWALPALAKAWQSVILICLVKASYEDVSWLRAAIVVAAQQAILALLGF